MKGVYMRQTGMSNFEKQKPAPGCSGAGRRMLTEEEDKVSKNTMEDRYDYLISFSP